MKKSHLMFVETPGEIIEFEDTLRNVAIGILKEKMSENGFTFRRGNKRKFAAKYGNDGAWIVDSYDIYHKAITHPINKRNKTFLAFCIGQHLKVYS